MKIGLISTNERFIEHGFRTISSCLRENGFDTRMFFMPGSSQYVMGTYSQKSLDKLYGLVKDCRIICVSSILFSKERTLQVIKFLKSRTDAFIVWGGIHATTCPDECIPEVDAIGVGECDLAMVELSKKIQNNENYLDTKNFWFNNKGKIVKNDIRHLVEDLDILPFPDYELEKQHVLKDENFVPAVKYFKENFLKLYNGMIIVFSARGCPNSCTFCSNYYRNKMQKGKGKIVRERSIDKFIDEIKYLRSKLPETKEVRITDDLFLLRNKEELKYFSKKYKKEIGLPFRCNSTPRLFDEEKVKILVDAGLNCMMIGAQSGSERINKDIYKRYSTNEMVVNASKVLKKYGVRRGQYHFIASNPYEEPEDVIASINLILNLVPPCEVSIFNLMLFPKTMLKEMVEKDKLFEVHEEQMTMDFSDNLNYMKFEKKNKYLNSLLRCLHGAVTKVRVGMLPRFMVKPLIAAYNTPLEKPAFAYIYYILWASLVIGHSYYAVSSFSPKWARVGLVNLIRKYNLR